MKKVLLTLLCVLITFLSTKVVSASENDLPLIQDAIPDDYRIPEKIQAEKNEKDTHDTEAEPQPAEEGVQLKNDSEESESEEDQQNSENADLNSILIEEVRKGNKEAVRGLLSLGADAYAKDKDGIDVLQIATDHGYEEIVKILKHYRETDHNWEMDNFWWRTKPKLKKPIKHPPGSIPKIILESPKHGTMGAKAGDLIIVEGMIDDITINTAKLLLNGVTIPLKVVNGRFRREIHLPDTRVTTFRVMATGRNGQTGYTTVHTVLIGDHINLWNWNPRSY